MKVEGWQRLWQLYETSAALAPHEWQSYLERATSDTELRAQVLAMLRDPHSSMGPGTAPPAAGAPALDRAGTRIGRYRVGQRLGQGGMGEVYGAADEELDRPVALKFVPSSRAGQLGISLDSLLREAKAASALNHPHIVTVHEVVRTESGLAIVMEQVAGTSLRSLCGSPVAPEKAAACIHQAARALEAAHASGIIHRDIKPENLMVRPDGYVKLLDFGLAKSVESAAVNSSVPSTAGTLRYMSPEQVRGEAPTPASDVFSLGVVMFELLTGAHPFKAPSLLQTMQAIASAEAVPPSRLRPAVPERLSALTLAMLSKDPQRRPAAGAVADRLSGVGAPRTAFRRRTVAAGVAVAAFAPVAGFLRYRSGRGTAVPPQIANPAPLAGMSGTESQAAFSPDGQEIAFVFRGDRDWNTHIYRKRLSSGAITRLTSDADPEINPIWSPDGRYLAFLRQDAGKRKIMVVQATGGPARQIGEIAEREHAFSLMCWQPDSRGVVASDLAADGTLELALYAIPLDASARRKLTSPPHGKMDAIPRFSPNGRHLAFARLGENGKGEFFLMPAAGGPERQLTTSSGSPLGLAWTADSRSFVVACNREGPYRLWRQPIAEGSVPERIEGSGDGVYDVAIAPASGRLAYRGASYSDVNIWRYSVPTTSSGAGPLIASLGFENDARYSPDGSQIAFVSSRQLGRPQIWTCAADGSGLRQLTNFGADQLVSGSPAWSPDGRHIAFDSRPPGETSAIFVIDARNGGDPWRLTKPGNTDFIPAWSSDGQFVYFASDRAGHIEIWRTPAAGGQPEQVTQHGGFEVFPTPDGRFLYYTKGQEIHGMWRLRIGADGAREEFVPELKAVARHRYWHGAREGIYFLDLRDRNIRLFSFSTRQLTVFAPAPNPPVPRYRGFTVAPDGRSFLYMQYDVRRSAIMLADGIR